LYIFKTDSAAGSLPDTTSHTGCSFLFLRFHWSCVQVGTQVHLPASARGFILARRATTPVITINPEIHIQHLFVYLARISTITKAIYKDGPAVTRSGCWNKSGERYCSSGRADLRFSLRHLAQRIWQMVQQHSDWTMATRLPQSQVFSTPIVRGKEQRISR
jgi:hypothetical protein